MLDYDLLMAQLKDTDGRILRTRVEKQPFIVKLNPEWIMTLTESSGRIHYLQRADVEECLQILEETGRLTRDEMDKIRGLEGNRATKLFAILAAAKLPGVAVTDNPRMLLLRKK